MFKVLIVDDEIYVVALVKKLIDWEKYNMKVEAEAYDGESALELVRKIKPDLVILDVRMPGYDGISFMNKVREFDKGIKFIVVSGHRQFDYVKGAISNSAEEYLLKPINKEEMESVLEKVYNQLTLESKKRKEIKEIEEKLIDTRRYVRRSIFSDIFNRGLGDKYADLESINQKFSTQFKPGKFALYAYILDMPIEFMNDASAKKVYKERIAKIYGELKKECYDVIMYEQNRVCYYLVNFEDKSSVAIKKMTNYLLGEFISKSNKFDKIYEHMCCLDTCDTIFETCENIELIQKYIYARIGTLNGKIIRSSDIVEDDEAVNAVWNIYDEKFKIALQTLDEGEIMIVVEQLFAKASYCLEEDSYIYIKLFEKVIDKLFLFFNYIGLSTLNEAQFKSDLLKRAMLAGNYSEYLKILYNKIKELIEKNTAENNNDSTPIIRIVKKYIEENYKEDISLASAADKVKISAGYLSRLFKKEENINFIEYLTQFRVEKSKELLKDIDYNIIQIADEVGFGNSKHFSKIFKKNVGITPTEYRKRHLGKGN